jgi:hypothetical protein
VVIARREDCAGNVQFGGPGGIAAITSIHTVVDLQRTPKVCISEQNALAVDWRQFDSFAAIASLRMQ